MKSTFKLPKLLLLALSLNSNVSNAQVGQAIVAQMPAQGQVLHAVYMNRSEKGANVFNSGFVPDATGRNDINAYLLSYLATAIYADKISEFEYPARTANQLAEAGNQLQLDSRAFVAKFKKVVSPYFSATTRYNGETMEFFEETSNYDGYDPEAMIIPTETAIYVTIRGTDRVGQNNNLNSPAFRVREWLQTDFQPMLFRPALPNGKSFTGQVHQGMWLSLSKIADRMANRIVQLGGATKKVWITGHSLGAGQAQLFAYYLAKAYNIKPQGVYGFAAPLVGNAAFYRDLENIIGGKSKLQRFEFMDDPVTGFALNLPGYGTGGTRVFYDFIGREKFDENERIQGEILRMSIGAGGYLAGLGGMCYHTQNWYMQAAYKQLTAAESLKVPPSLPVPDRTFMACESGLDITRAMSDNQIIEGSLDIMDGVLQLVTDAIQSNISKLSSAVKNFSGSALKNGEGKYRIKCLDGGRYLNVDGHCYTENSCGVMLWETTARNNNELFEVTKYGLGYGIKVMAPNTNKVLDVEGMSLANNASVKTYDKHVLPILPNNQIWYFHQIGSTNKYILQNERSGKVLEADKSNTNTPGCAIRQKVYSPGATNQTWILEKVN